ncbi:MAG TPA: hypothetical protein VGI82_11540 [Chitinophagaceae bacterium]
MKKRILLSLRFALLMGSVLIYSCRREVPKTETANNSTIAKINLWLDRQKQHQPANKIENIELVRNNLSFPGMHYERSENGELLLIIPISEKFKSIAGVDNNSIPCFTLFIDRYGNISNGNVVLYAPGDISITEIPRNSFYDIFNTGQPRANGRFQFLAVNGAPQYLLNYKDGRLISSGIYKFKKDSTAAGKTTATQCTAWYLVTDFYDSQGHIVNETWEYLYTTCSGQCGSGKFASFCAGDDGGGGSDNNVNCCISDPNANLSVRQVSDPGTDECGLESIDPVTGLHTRKCTHAWYFSALNIMWYAWKYGSIEESDQKKQGTNWVFTSVTHKSMITTGTVPPCITCVCNVASSLPSFSGSVARMALIYTLTFAYPCLPKAQGGSQNVTDHASTQWVAK